MPCADRGCARALAAPKPSLRTCSARCATALRRRRIRRCARSAEHRRPTGDAAGDARLRDKDAMAPSRIGNPPVYGLPAASGASASGYDSLNRTRKKPKFYPGQAKPKPPPGPGSRAPASRRRPVRLSVPPSDARQQDADPAGDGRHGGRPAAAQAAQDRRRSVRRGRRLRRQLPDQVRGRTHAAATTPIPRRTFVPKGSPFYMIAPEFLAVSDWQRHAVVADLRGSFTGYGNTFPPPTDGTISSAPVDCRPAGFQRPCRRPPRRQPRHPPDGPGAVAAFDRQSRQPEHPGRPCQISGLHDARQHRRRRPDLQPAAGFRRRHRRPHRLSPIRNSPTARSTSNDDRNFNAVRRRRPRQLRSVARPQTVRRDRRATPACTTSGSTAMALRATPRAATSRPAPVSNSRGC